MSATEREVAGRLATEIARLAGEEHVRFMEVCGGHTHTIYRYGIPSLLPENVEFVHGPGCPVCVIPMGRVDDAIALATEETVTLCCFGDLLRVPGGRGSLMEARAEGADVRIVYSPLDALALAEREPDRQVVFLAVGFETTAPATALTVLRAAARGVANFSVLCNHVTIEEPLRALLGAPGVALDGLIGPGHVAVVTGAAAFGFVAKEFSLPIVVSGFEPNDLLESVAMLLRQRHSGRWRAENQYRRAVSDEGNLAAQAVMAQVFTRRARFAWRGLGEIERSAYGLREEFSRFDAERRFAVPGITVPDPRACRCGEVLRGVRKPWQCGVFGTACTPERPIGTCMVSSEGACAAYYHYGRLGGLRREPAVGR
ncbi:MAG: hydrogenase formation protein HypD [Actinomycetota bacterium]|nr:hydrogenase formation protein HypD [Actinomycetota bacterium]